MGAGASSWPIGAWSIVLHLPSCDNYLHRWWSWRTLRWCRPLCGKCGIFGLRIIDVEESSLWRQQERGSNPLHKRLDNLHLRSLASAWPLAQGLTFPLLQNLVKVCTHWKTYQASWSISWCSICKQLHRGFSLKKTPFKNSFMLSRKFYIISDQQYVIHIYLSEMS